MIPGFDKNTAGIPVSEQRFCQRHGNWEANPVFRCWIDKGMMVGYIYIHCCQKAIEAYISNGYKVENKGEVQ